MRAKVSPSKIDFLGVGREGMDKETKKHIKELLDKKEPYVIVIAHKGGTEWWGTAYDIIGICESVKHRMLASQIGLTRTTIPDKRASSDAYHM